MKKNIFLSTLLLGSLFLSGCVKKDDFNQLNSNTNNSVNKVENGNSEIIVPQNVYKDCPAEYFEKIGSSVPDCSKFEKGPVCVYYKLLSNNKIKNLEQTSECQACRNYVRPDKDPNYDEFLGMEKGECYQGMYKKK